MNINFLISYVKIYIIGLIEGGIVMNSLSNNKSNDNLIISSIDAIYKYGGFSVEKGNYKYKLFVDIEGNLILEGTNSENNTTLSSNKINKFLALICFRTFFNRDKSFLKIIPEPIDIPTSLRLKAANDIYNIYEGILVKNRDIISDVIINTDESAFIDSVSNNIYSFKSFNNLMHNIDLMASEYREDLICGLSLYKELLEADDDTIESVKKRWDNFVTQSIVPDTKKVPQKKPVKSLEEYQIPYEIINERKFIVDPAMGRAKEIRELGAALLTYAVNPILLGEPGVGKTAIIEGLAYRIQKGLLPEKLQAKKILKISPASLVSGCIYRGSFEERMENLIEFLKDNEEYILYVDEMHTAFGAGSSMSSDNDMLNIIKPYIENGDIKIIGATTTYEYNDILLKDKAFSRRLKPITIKEPNDFLLKTIIQNSIVKYETISGIPFTNNEALKSNILDILIESTGEKNRTYKEKRYNPALVLSIIEQAFGYALYDQKEYVEINYIVEALSSCENLYETSRNDAIKKLKNISYVPKPKIIELKPL